ncbi:hypothetical protein GOP47_0026374 [Adiantum capillus-veneris]|nr:hypothetical protein GOP47_0026374 [Adiantum capillus-veneris]
MRKRKAVMTHLAAGNRRGSAASNVGDASALREEYARKSDELLDYVAFLEASIERLKADALSQHSRYDTENHLICHQIDVAVAKVHEAHCQINTHLAARHDSEHKLQDALFRLQEEESRSKFPQFSTSRSLKQEDILASDQGKSRRKPQEQSRVKSPPRSPARTPRR